MRNWKKKHPKLVKEYQRRWVNRHREHVNEYNRTHKYPESLRKASCKWRKNNPKKASVYSKVNNNPKEYPLDSKCAFCGTIKNLEHGHLDYEDDGHNYLTVCTRCNIWMGK